MNANTEDVLAIAGVRVEAPLGMPEHFGAWVAVGTLIEVDGGGVRAVPRHGLTPAQYRRFVDVAGRVWAGGRAVLGGWVRDDELGWVVSVALRQASDDTDAAEALEAVTA